MGTARAATPDSVNDMFRYQPGAANFSTHELKYDLYGVWASHSLESHHGGDALGVGFGVDYFFMRYLGVDGETYVDRFDWPNHVTFNLVGRYPIEKYNIAPYVFGGFGRQFHDIAQWTTDVGAGVDFRLNRSTGLFLDVRQNFPDVSDDFTMWRLGVRFGF